MLQASVCTMYSITPSYRKSSLCDDNLNLAKIPILTFFNRHKKGEHYYCLSIQRQEKYSNIWTLIEYWNIRCLH